MLLAFTSALRADALDGRVRDLMTGRGELVERCARAAVHALHLHEDDRDGE
jgi:hypothetical protein